MGSCASKNPSINLPNSELPMMKERKSVPSAISSPDHSKVHQTNTNILDHLELTPASVSTKRHYRHRFFHPSMRKMKQSKHSLSFSLKSSFKLTTDSESFETSKKANLSSFVGEVSPHEISHSENLPFIDSDVQQTLPSASSHVSSAPTSEEHISPTYKNPMHSLSTVVNSSKEDGDKNNITVRPLDLWARPSRYSRTGNDDDNSSQQIESQAASLKWPSDRYQHSREQREAPYHRLRHSYVPPAFVHEDGIFDLLPYKRFSNPLSDATPTVEAFKFHYGEETYREYKLQHLNYISRPRKCCDNYKQEIYDKWKRYSTCSTISSGSDNTPNPKLFQSSGEQHPMLKSPSSPLSVPDNCSMSLSGGIISLTTGQNILVRKPLVLDSIRNPPLLSPSSIVSAQSTMNAIARSSSPYDNDTSPSQQPTSSQPTNSTPCAHSPIPDSPLSKEENVTTPVGHIVRQSALSNVSSISLNSSDLMLTTDVGLDAEDDDVVKDLYGSEKEDPFLLYSSTESKPSIEESPPQACVDPKPEAAIIQPLHPSNNEMSPTTPNQELDRSLLRRLRSLPKRKCFTEPRPHSLSSSFASETTTAFNKDEGCSQSMTQINSKFSHGLISPQNTLPEEDVENVEDVSNVSSLPVIEESSPIVTNVNLSSADPILLLNSSDCRQMMQDVSTMKLTLLKLRRMLLEDEGHMPAFRNPTRRIIQRRQTTGGDHIISEPVTPSSLETTFMCSNHDISGANDFKTHETASCEDLLRLREMDYVTQLPQTRLQQLVCQLSSQVCILKSSLREQENTIQLLQTQMTKYTQPGTKVCTPVNPSYSVTTPNGIFSSRSHPFYESPLNRSFENDTLTGYSPGFGSNYSPSLYYVSCNPPMPQASTTSHSSENPQSLDNPASDNVPQCFNNNVNDRKMSLPRPSFLGIQQASALDHSDPVAECDSGHADGVCSAVPS